LRIYLPVKGSKYQNQADKHWKIACLLQNFRDELWLKIGKKKRRDKRSERSAKLFKIDSITYN